MAREGPDQTAHPRSLIRTFAVRSKKLLIPGNISLNGKILIGLRGCVECAHACCAKNVLISDMVKDTVLLVAAQLLPYLF